jgi:DNA-binding transcriptional MerR regulator
VSPMRTEAETEGKLYRSISEVSEMLDVKPHVLRYWETQFGMLRPKKNRAGNRMYRPEELRTLQRIKELLYERRFTIAGARRKLLDEQKQPVDGQPQPEAGFADADRKAALTEIKAELKKILAKLAREPETRETRATAARSAKK